VLGWGSTYGVITTAVQRARAQGKRVSAAHLRYLNPLPANLGDVLRRYDQVLMPEVNLGQMRLLVRGTYLVDVIGLNKVSGRPFTIAEIEEKISELVG
jgi:2-oxoglutarate ferredoxin oxidoreductase subunit alpha